MTEILRPIRFDFEKQYLLDMHGWTRKLTNSDILINTFDKSKTDVKFRGSVDDGLQKITDITSFVKTGHLCGHSQTLTESYLPWITNQDGRIWSATDLQKYKDAEESGFKLKKLLDIHTDTLRHIIQYRKIVLNEFKTYDSIFPKRYKKNLFKHGLKLDEKVREYQNILKTEMTIRNVLLSTLASRKKKINRKHKTLLRDLIQLLNKVTIHLCFDKSDHKQNGDKNNSSFRIRKCPKCHGNKKCEQEGDLIDFSDDWNRDIESDGRRIFF